MSHLTVLERSAQPARLDEVVDTGESDTLALHGTTVVFRPIEPGDLDLEREFVAGLSKRTSYQRLMSGRTPTAAELERWTKIDREHEGAVIAKVTHHGRERLIGVARYAMEPGADEAEFAIVIADAWQGKGLGVHLLSRLIALARKSAARRLFGTTLTENRAMLELGRRFGFKLSRAGGAAFITAMSLPLGMNS
jgi:acetyltransferase